MWGLRKVVATRGSAHSISRVLRDDFVAFVSARGSSRFPSGDITTVEGEETKHNPGKSESHYYSIDHLRLLIAERVLPASGRSQSPSGIGKQLTRLFS